MYVISMEIRAVVLHVDEHTLNSRERIDSELASFLENVDKFASATGLKMLSLRVVTPPTSRERLPQILRPLYELIESHGINYLGVPLTQVEPDAIVELLAEHPRLFLSVEYSPEQEIKVAETLRIISSRSYLHATRFAVSFGERVQTPYFPATETRETGITMSFLYLDLFERDDALEVVTSKLMELEAQASTIFGRFAGFDTSLSPWMDHSVARLIEKISGVVFTLPGTIAAIRTLNSMLEKLSASIRTTGFNEVMLPLAEDNRLKELARLGQLRFSHLLNYSSYCVAGLDMVPIPDSTEDAVLLGILRDLWHIYLLKRKSLGMRIVLAPAEEGDDIDLGMFGKTPVLSPLA